MQFFFLGVGVPAQEIPQTNSLQGNGNRANLVPAIDQGKSRTDAGKKTPTPSAPAPPLSREGHHSLRFVMDGCQVVAY